MPEEKDMYDDTTIEYFETYLISHEKATLTVSTIAITRAETEINSYETAASLG